MDNDFLGAGLDDDQIMVGEKRILDGSEMDQLYQRWRRKTSLTLFLSSRELAGSTLLSPNRGRPLRYRSSTEAVDECCRQFCPNLVCRGHGQERNVRPAAIVGWVGCTGCRYAERYAKRGALVFRARDRESSVSIIGSI